MISDQWLEPAARGIHDAVCGCNGPQHYTYYLNALRRDREEVERLRGVLAVVRETLLAPFTPRDEIPGTIEDAVSYVDVALKVFAPS